MSRKDRGLNATLDWQPYWASEIAPVQKPAEWCVATLRDKANAEDVSFTLHGTQVLLEDPELISLVRSPGSEVESPSHLLLGVAKGGRNPRPPLQRDQPQLAKGKTN